MKLQAKKANLVKKKKKKEKSLVIWHQGQHSHHRHTLSFTDDQQGCLEVAANNALSLSSAVGRPFFAQQPATFWFLAVCGCFLQTHGSCDTHCERDWAVMPGKKEVSVQVTRSKEEILQK